MELSCHNRTTNHEPPCIVEKISDGKLVDLSLLSKEELLRLHHDEEVYTAQKLLNLPPFSQERMNLMNRGYDLIHTIQRHYLSPSKKSFGSSNRSTRLVCEFVAREKRNLMIYEAGTGSGFSCSKFLKYPNVFVRGCDVYVMPDVKQLMQENPERIHVEEDTLYNDLQKLEDESIDIFYADNVFEHLFPDEFPEIMKLLVSKLKQGALLFLFIPNSISGPHDVSRYSVKAGEKSQGFHFMELTYKEMIERCKQWGIVPAYFTYMNLLTHYRYIKDSSGKLNKFKMFVEGILRFIPAGIMQKTHLLEVLAMNVYIFKKR